MDTPNGPVIGVIGGSGLYDMPGLTIVREQFVRTPYGDPSGPYRIGELGGVRLAFLPRHGAGHSIPPHRINYRANIWGFHHLGAERVISINATGGISPALQPGGLVLPDQMLDMTQGTRASTYYEEGEAVHVDFTDPYCPELRSSLLRAGREGGIDLADRGTYICVSGPRLESRAEIALFAAWGADLVGMTGMPEAVLARELEICMASVSVVTNRAAGIAGGKLTTDEVMGVMAGANEKLKTLLARTLPLIPPSRGCPCSRALTGARLGGGGKPGK